MSAIPKGLYSILHAVCLGTRCDDCSLLIKGFRIDSCMEIKIKNGKAKPEYLERLWEAYKNKCPEEAERASDEIKEFLGVKPPIKINITEEDMMNLFS